MTQAIRPADGPVAVTGSAGYIGSHIVLNLVRHGYSVRACVRDASKLSNTAHLRAMNHVGPGSVELHSCDMTVPGAYDAVFAGFWLSHVPPDRMDAFAETVAGALEPDGKFFCVDSRWEPLSTAADHTLPPETSVMVTRRLDDGRQFRIVKIFWKQEKLERHWAHAGITLELRQTPKFFIYGLGRP